MLRFLFPNNYYFQTWSCYDFGLRFTRDSIFVVFSDGRNLILTMTLKFSFFHNDHQNEFCPSIANADTFQVIISMKIIYSTKRVKRFDAK